MTNYKDKLDIYKRSVTRSITHNLFWFLFYLISVMKLIAFKTKITIDVEGDNLPFYIKYNSNNINYKNDR